MSAFEQITTTGPNPAKCPAALQAGLLRFAQQRIPTGSFLRAVLETDLRRAFAAADPVTLAHMQDILAYAYQELPALSWGSPERVKAWLERRV